MDFTSLFLFPLSIPGYEVRFITALLSLIIFTFYDLWNNKNIPDIVVYTFLLMAVVQNIVFFNQELLMFFLITTFPIAILLVLLSHFGYIGSADVYAFIIIALLIPKTPQSLPFNFPFIFSLILTAGCVFSFCFLIYIFLFYILKGKRGNFLYLGLLIPYLLLLYMIFQLNLLPIYFIAGMFTLILSSTLYLVYKQEVLKSMAREVDIDKVEEEDVVALELLPNNTSLPRVLNKENIKALKEKGVKKILIYTGLPPFLPFLLLAFLIDIFILF